MTAEIWNTYELAVAATTGGLIVGVATVGLMVLKRLDGARELATAKGWWEKAIKVQEANDKARWAPAYSENLFAIEADKPHDAELPHVAYPTQELRLVADDPQVAAGLSRLADEVGLVQALSDRPAADEDEVGDEQPGEAWFARLKDGFDDMARGVTDAINWPIKLAQQVAAAWRRRRDERYLIGSGEQATSADPFAELLSTLDAVKPVPVRIVRVNRYRDPGLTGQFPYVKVAGAPRHAAPEPEMPAINASIPTQRGEVQA